MANPYNRLIDDTELLIDKTNAARKEVVGISGYDHLHFKTFDTKAHLMWRGQIIDKIRECKRMNEDIDVFESVVTFRDCRRMYKASKNY